MSYTEEESRQQENLWFMHVTELSLGYVQAQLLVDLIMDQMNQGLNEDERIIVHFTGEGAMKSDVFEKHTLERITTILDCTLNQPSKDVYEVDRLVEAYRLTNYEKLKRDIMK